MLASILLFPIGFISIAQGGAPPPPIPAPPPGLPVDNGIILLFIVGLVYGIYKAHKHSKQAALTS